MFKFTFLSAILFTLSNAQYTSSGDLTFYFPGNGLGSCGTPLANTDHICAVSFAMSSQIQCGTCLKVTGPKGEIVVKVMDKCEGCSDGDLDLSHGAFVQIADEAEGRVPGVKWQVVDCQSQQPQQQAPQQQVAAVQQVAPKLPAKVNPVPPPVQPPKPAPPPAQPVVQAPVPPKTLPKTIVAPAIAPVVAAPPSLPKVKADIASIAPVFGTERSKTSVYGCPSEPVTPVNASSIPTYGTAASTNNQRLNTGNNFNTTSLQSGAQTNTVGLSLVSLFMFLFY